MIIDLVKKTNPEMSASDLMTPYHNQKDKPEEYLTIILHKYDIIKTTENLLENVTLVMLSVVAASPVEASKAVEVPSEQ